jgi:hypothetical protein
LAGETAGVLDPRAEHGAAGLVDGAHRSGLSHHVIM